MVYGYYESRAHRIALALWETAEVGETVMAISALYGFGVALVESAIRVPIHPR